MVELYLKQNNINHFCYIVCYTIVTVLFAVVEAEIYSGEARRGKIIHALKKEGRTCGEEYGAHKCELLLRGYSVNIQVVGEGEIVIKLSTQYTTNSINVLHKYMNFSS